MTSPKTEYQAKVTRDTGLARGRVPAPLLRVMGARPGDYLIFRLAGRGQASVRVSRAGKKSGQGKRKSR